MEINENAARDVAALRVSHKAMLEALVQIWEEILCPLDKLLPDIEYIIANAEKLEASEHGTP